MRDKSYTEQENIVAKILSCLGIRYEQQAQIGKYYADFFCPAENMVIECDGIWGHLRKSDRKRDLDLLELGIGKVLHLKQTSKIGLAKELKELLCQE